MNTNVDHYSLRMSCYQLRVGQIL